MALGLTQPLTEMSTRDISCGVKAASAYGWQPYHFHVPIWRLNLLKHPGPVQGCTGIALPLPLQISLHFVRCHFDDAKFVHSWVPISCPAANSFYKPVHYISLLMHHWRSWHHCPRQTVYQKTVQSRSTCHHKHTGSIKMPGQLSPQRNKVKCSYQYMYATT